MAYFCQNVLKIAASSIVGQSNSARFAAYRLASSKSIEEASNVICSIIAASFVAAAPSYQHIIVEKQGAKTNVGVITLNRPKALNALCDALMREVSTAIDELEKDKDVGAVVITGSEKAFAAGKIT
jgi:enoyl-CoA hydratase